MASLCINAVLEEKIYKIDYLSERFDEIFWYHIPETEKLLTCLFQEIFVWRQIFLIITSKVGRHGFFDPRRNSKKDGQGDEIGNGSEHTFPKFKISNKYFLISLKKKRSKKYVKLIHHSTSLATSTVKYHVKIVKNRKRNEFSNVLFSL